MCSEVLTIIGASRDRCIFRGGFTIAIEGEENDNVAITDLTICEAKEVGVAVAGASVQLNNVAVNLLSMIRLAIPQQ